MSKEIEKKTWPEYFELVKSGKKKYEFRLADFDIAEGDTLILKEWDPKTKKYTGRELEKEITQIGLGRLDVNDEEFWSKEEIEKYGFYILSIE